MKKRNIILVGLLPLLFGCSATDYMQESLKVYKANKLKSQQTKMLKTTSKRVFSGEELICRVADFSYDSRAHCRSKSGNISFYTTFRQIKSKYKILHQREVSNRRTNMKGLPDDTLAHLEMWVVKK